MPPRLPSPACACACSPQGDDALDDVADLQGDVHVQHHGAAPHGQARQQDRRQQRADGVHVGQQRRHHAGPGVARGEDHLVHVAALAAHDLKRAAQPRHDAGEDHHQVEHPPGVDTAVQREPGVQAAHAALVAEAGLLEQEPGDEHRRHRQHEAPVHPALHDRGQRGLRRQLARLGVLHLVDVGLRVPQRVVAQVGRKVVGDVVHHQRGDDEGHVELFKQPAGERRIQRAGRRGRQHGRGNAQPARHGQVVAHQRRRYRAQYHLALAAHGFIAAAPGHAHRQAAHDDGRGALERVHQVDLLAEGPADHFAVGQQRVLADDEYHHRAQQEADQYGDQRLGDRIHDGQQRPLPVALIVHARSPPQPSKGPSACRPCCPAGTRRRCGLRRSHRCGPRGS